MRLHIDADAGADADADTDADAALSASNVSRYCNGRWGEVRREEGRDKVREGETERWRREEVRKVRESERRTWIISTACYWFLSCFSGISGPERSR